MEFESIYWRSQPFQKVTLDKNTKFGNRFLLDKQIGIGGSGEVWISQDLILKQPVAIKISSTSIKREVIVLRNLPRDRFISIFDFVKDENIGAYGYAMEILRKPWATINEFSNKIKPKEKYYSKLNIQRIRKILLLSLDILVGLNHLHGKKNSRSNIRWCHGDIKPGNLYIELNKLKNIEKNFNAKSWEPFTKIGDLGLAQSVGKHIPGGTPTFWAPEQRLGKPVHPKTDIFSLGKTIAYVIANEYWSDDDMAREQQIRDEILNLVPSYYLSFWLAKKLNKMTLKTQYKRPEGKELISSLKRILSNNIYWDIITEFSILEDGILLKDIPDFIFPVLKKRFNWQRRNSGRDQIIITHIKNAKKAGWLYTSGKKYYSV